MNELKASQERQVIPATRPEVRTAIHVTHVVLTTQTPYAAVCATLESLTGTHDPALYGELVSGERSPETIRLAFKALEGPSGFIRFARHEHGALLKIKGQDVEACQYIIGNPLIAINMTEHDIRAGLYAPLRLLVYVNATGQTQLEYDLPSSLFGQFGSPGVDLIAAQLDAKFAALLAAATRHLS